MNNYQTETIKGKITYMNTWPSHDEEMPIAEKDRKHFIICVMVEGHSVELIVDKTEEYASYKRDDEVFLEKHTTDNITEYLREIFSSFYSYEGETGPKINYALLGKSKVKLLTRKPR